MRCWIRYIGIKYPQLQKLDLKLHKLDIMDAMNLTTTLMTALSNMEHLESYSVNVCPTKQPIMDVMTASGIQLQHFGFLVDGEEATTGIFSSIQTSLAVSRIQSLALTCTSKASP